MQSVPLAVLKRETHSVSLAIVQLHAIRTACGIETAEEPPSQTQRGYCMQSVPLAVLKRPKWTEQSELPQLHAIRTACGIET